MKLLKKFLTILLSLFLILTITPANDVLAEGPYNIRTLQVGDLLIKGNKLQSGSMADAEFILSTTDGKYNYKNVTEDSCRFTLDRNYLVESVVATGEIDDHIVLAPAVKLTVNKDGVAEAGYPKYYDARLPFSIDEETNVITIGEDTYTADTTGLGTGETLNWTWKSDNASHSTYELYTSSAADAPMFFLCGEDLELDINYVKYTPETSKGLAFAGNITSDVVKTDEDKTYQLNILDDKGHVFEDTTQTINVSQVDEGGTEISALDPITYNNGYNFELPDHSTEGDLYYKFSINGTVPLVSITICIHVVPAVKVYDEVIENDGWPWATTSKSGDMKLMTALRDTSHTPVTYQWQISSDNMNYENLVDNIPSIGGSTTATLTLNGMNPAVYNTWYRCKIDYDGTETVYTKGVKVLKTSSMNIVCNDSEMSAYYISNGKGAYAIEPAAGKLNVLGLWHGYWVGSSYDQSWSLYMKESNSVTPKDLTNIDVIRTRFDDYYSNEVIFDVKFTNECDAALYTYNAIGNVPNPFYGHAFFGGNGLYGATKANISNGKFVNIQSFTTDTFAEGNEDTCAFVLIPLNEDSHAGSLKDPATFTIDNPENVDYINDQYYYKDYDGASGYSYGGCVSDQVNLIFKYNNGPRTQDFIDWYDDPFIYRTVNGNKAAAAIYDTDHVTAMSWTGVYAVSFKLGIGRAGDLEGINYEDLTNGGGGGGGGHHYIEVPNTSASTR